MRLFKRLIILGVALAGCALLASQLFAAQQKEVSKKEAAKTAVKKVETAVSAEVPPRKARRVVEGSVVTVTKRAIAVEFEVTKDGSSEMLLPLGSNLTLEGGIKTLTELKYGDKVKVGIEQTIKDNADGTTTLMKTEALVVALIQRAPEQAAAAAESE